MGDSHCNGEHRFFVADVAVVEAEGKVCIMALCTACGTTQMTTHKVTEGHPFTTLKTKEN